MQMKIYLTKLNEEIIRGLEL